MGDYVGMLVSSGSSWRLHMSPPVWPSADRGIGENSLRQPKDLEISLLHRIMRLGEEAALMKPGKSGDMKSAQNLGTPYLIIEKRRKLGMVSPEFTWASAPKAIFRQADAPSAS
jgi:hypothetical protein